MKQSFALFLFLTTVVGPCFSQRDVLLKKLMANTISFDNFRKEWPNAQGNAAPQLPEIPLEVQLCAEPSDILVQISDSLYAYSIENNTTALLGKIAPGIASSFDIRLDPFPEIVAAVRWDSIYTNDGSGWEYSMHHANGEFELAHLGAGLKTTYFTGGNLWFYNGITQPKLIRNNIRYAVADLVVDDQERTWILTATMWPIADTLRVIDSTGVSICDIPFTQPVSTFNGYGMFIYDGDIYVGFGNGNPNFYDKAVPLVMDFPFVHFGTPVPMNPDFDIDLGSCEKWVRYPICESVSTDEQVGNAKIGVFPNPFSNELQVNFQGQGKSKITFYNALGIQIATYETSGSLVLQTEHWAQGVYQCFIESEGKRGEWIRVVKVDSP